VNKSKWCEDCGTKWADGCCPNCHEELHMEITQAEWLGDTSEEWNKKVSEQAEDVKRKKTKCA
jgi:hypothetical protein